MIQLITVLGVSVWRTADCAAIITDNLFARIRRVTLRSAYWSTVGRVRCMPRGNRGVVCRRCSGGLPGDRAFSHVSVCYLPVGFAVGQYARMVCGVCWSVWRCVVFVSMSVWCVVSMTVWCVVSMAVCCVVSKAVWCVGQYGGMVCWSVWRYDVLVSMAVWCAGQYRGMLCGQYGDMVCWS